MRVAEDWENGWTYIGNVGSSIGDGHTSPSVPSLPITFFLPVVTNEDREAKIPRYLLIHSLTARQKQMTQSCHGANFEVWGFARSARRT